MHSWKKFGKQQYAAGEFPGSRKKTKNGLKIIFLLNFVTNFPLIKNTVGNAFLHLSLLAPVPIMLHF